MTDYFVDGGAGGTGDGLTPANAFVSVLSIPWANNVYAWIRNTHREVVVNTITGGGATAAFQKGCFLIGWPQNDMPFYDGRPAAGVSASWDSDVPNTAAYSLCGYKFPTLVGSSTNGRLNFAGQLEFANCYVTNSVSATGTFFSAQASWERGMVPNNIVILFKEGPITSYSDQLAAKKIILVVSNNNATGLGIFQSPVCLVHDVVISSLTVASNILNSLTNGTTLRHIVNYSNSVSYLIGHTGNDDSARYLTLGYVGRLSGVQPFSGFTDGSVTTHWPPVICDDYYGFGPVILSNQYDGLVRASSGNEAKYHGGPVMNLTVSSIAAGTQSYRGAYVNHPLIRKLFDVTSGTQVTVHQPVWVGTTAVHSMGGGQFAGNLMARGAGMQNATNSSFQAGSYSDWAGSLMIGSAYELLFTWTPRETGRVPFELLVNAPVQTTSGQGLIGYTLFGEPYAV